MEERIKQLEEENRILKIKADKWDKLDDQIAAFYPEDENGDYDEEFEGNLLDIGEIAASAFGYL